MVGVRQQARLDGLHTYHGKPCKRCGTTEKYTSIATCVACRKSDAAKESYKEYYYASERFKRHVEEGTSRLMKPKRESKDIRRDIDRRSRLKQFGINESDYEKMLNEQEGECAICKTPASSLNKPLAIDHCHRTGRVRGLLCTSCNVGLGMAKDSIEILEAMIFYLGARDGTRTRNQDF